MEIGTFNGITVFVDELYDKSQFMFEFNTPEILESTSLEYPLKEERPLSTTYSYVVEGEKRFIFKKNGKIIGSADLYNIEEGHKATIRYWVAKSAWGQGVATNSIKLIISYCFEKLCLVRVDAYVFEDNIGSKRVLEKVGFENEGFLKNFDKKGDKLISEYIYAICK